MVAIHPQNLAGRWLHGVALDFHTTRSTPVGPNESGHMQFETERPEIAELLYQLKYKGNMAAMPAIVAAASAYLVPHLVKLDILVPVPPSTMRRPQPVLLLAQAIGESVGLPFADCITTTRTTTPLKGVTDPQQRQALVEGLYAVDRAQTSGKSVLLFDDLYRSGTTLNAITGILLDQGQAASVRVLTVTKTRSHQ